MNDALHPSERDGLVAEDEEIAVTSEMIHAGTARFVALVDTCSLKFTIDQVYRAMERARRQKKGGTGHDERVIGGIVPSSTGLWPIFR